MYFNELTAAYDQALRERNAFHDLMRIRVREVLLVASLYDSFVMESDGILTEQIYGEYFSLNLNAIPRITSAYSAESALELFNEQGFDLVIIMAGIDFEVPLKLAADLKAAHADVPVLLLAMNNTCLSRLDLERALRVPIDRVFVWNGYSKLFVGMIKYVEDLRNVEADTKTGLVRVILLIEDSVRYYSRYLPLLYKVILRQTQSLIEEEKGVETYKVLRSRARPKLLLASSYEEAQGIFDRYEPDMLTVISDLRFPRDGALEREAGFDFLRMVRERVTDLPVMIQSSEPSIRERAYAIGASFADKNSESLEHELADFFQENLGFGPFKFRDASGALLAVARNMEEFTARLTEMPPECLVFHGGRNHFSTWLSARGETQFARLLKNYRIEDFGSVQDMRAFMKRLLDQARREKSKGMAPNFEAALCHDENCVSMLAGGSVGGKGRGILFIRSLLDNLDFTRHVPGIEVKIPRSACIGTDAFERFLEDNNLWSFAYYENREPEKHDELRERFLSTALDPGLVEKLRRFLEVTESPLAVRSSGLFEDMLMLPFSGIYDTYVIPNEHPDIELRLGQLCDAVRLIYASLFSPESRRYFESARYNLEEERMAVVIQELVGSRRGRWFYPWVSGTAQSYNYYPVSYLKPDDGVCVAALGLGSYVVEGGRSHRFCPRYPRLDIIKPERLLESSQRVFRALDMDEALPDLRSGENAALGELPIAEAEGDPRFALFASTWDKENDRLEPGLGSRGPRVIDLANILKHEALPLAKAVEMTLDVVSRSMGVPVEIEYAFNLDGPAFNPAFYILQIKPLVRVEDGDEVRIDLGSKKGCLVFSERSMGNGHESALSDIVWVDPGRFDPAKSFDIAAEVEKFNAELKRAGRGYLLIGPGRWGSSDHRLGVPVSFPQISETRVIVEADLPDFRVESSLGSHFFHNVTSMNIGYLTVSAGSESFVDWELLASLPREAESDHCVWSRLPGTLDVVMDGRSGKALVKVGSRPSAPVRRPDF